MPRGEGVEDRRREPSRRLPKRSQARRRPVEQTRGGFIFYVWWSKIEENDSCPSPVPPSTEFSLVAWAVTRVGEHKKSNFPPTSGYIFGQVRPSQALPRRRSWIPCIPLSIQAPPRLRRSPNPESGPENPGLEIWAIAGVLCRCSPRHRSREAACIASLHHLCIRVASDQFSGHVYDRIRWPVIHASDDYSDAAMIDISARFATRRHASRLTRSRLSQFFSQTTQSWSGSIPHSGSNSTGISFIWASLRQDWSLGRRRNYFLIITLKNH